jgi:hypothetical protein
MQSNFRSLDLAFVLFWVALALLGIYAVTVVAAALPVQLLQPDWIERVCGSLRGGVSFPLIALALLILSEHAFDSAEERRFVTQCRRWASFAALGFVLMIPLQTWAGLRVVQQSNASEQAQLRPYTRALSAIRAANSQADLIGALASLPGTPANLGGSFKEPLAQVRDQLLNEIEPQLKAKQAQLTALQNQRWQQGLLRWFKDALVALFSAIGLAAIGRTAAERPTLLEIILNPRPQQRRQLDHALGVLMPPDDDPMAELPDNHKNL